MAGYPEALACARRRTGEHQSIVCGRGVLGGTDAVLLAFDFGFVGGSVGRRTGDQANGASAEAAGLASAIAELFLAVANAEVPVTTLVTGEGGSGGALALASSSDTWIAANAYFAVIAPELAAGVLKRDPTDAPAIADLLHLRPQDLVYLGLARSVRLAE